MISKIQEPENPFKITVLKDENIGTQSGQIVDVSALKKVIEKAQAIGHGKKTPNAWDALQSAIRDAETVVEDPISEDMVKREIAVLEKAIEVFQKSPEDDQSVNLTDPLAQPAKIKVKASGNHANISWKKVKGAKGYIVYQQKGKKFKAVATTSKTTATIKGLSVGNTYKFKVRAFQKTKGKKILGKESKAVVLKMVLSVTKITKAIRSGKNIRFSWKKVSGATGYQIVFAKKKNGSFKTLTKVNKGKIVSVIKKRVAKKVYVKIRAYKKQGKKMIYSKYSAIKFVK